MQEYILTVMAKDRVGILRDVSTALATLEGNITHLSQTVMRGHFTLIISVQIPDDRTQLEIKQAVERSGEVGELDVSIRPYTECECFNYPTERFTLSMQGKDQPGIIASTTSHLAGRGINIDDFYSYVKDGVLLMLAQVSVPVGADIEDIQAELEQVGKRFGLIAHLQHENIFRVTNDVKPVEL